MENFKNRKTTRLQDADYNNGIFFLTLCTKNRQCLLSRIVETNISNAPQVELLPYGQIADKYIKQLNEFYDNILIEDYVIMPNHIHIMLFVKKPNIGPSETTVHTMQNTIVSRFLSTLKRFCNKEYGMNIWQYRSNDHIIRNHTDYEEHLKYIYENPIKWYFDELYSEE